MNTTTQNSNSETDNKGRLEVGTEPSAANESIEPDQSVRAAGRTVNLRTLLIAGGWAAAALAVVVVIAVLGWQLASKSSDLDSLQQQSSNDARAEQVSLDYATGAAEMNFENPAEWSDRLTAGTSPELATRLRQAATSMEQLIVPLQWTSTATPIAAKVESESAGIYEVTCFVNVLTKNLQAPDGIESTATYKMSIDSTDDWKITQISGIGAAPAGDVPSGNAVQDSTLLPPK